MIKQLKEEGLTNVEIRNGKGDFRVRAFTRGRACARKTSFRVPTWSDTLGILFGFEKSKDKGDLFVSALCEKTQIQYKNLVLGEI